MNRNKKNHHKNADRISITLKEAKKLIDGMNDGEAIEAKTENGHDFNLVYIRTLIDTERLNEAIIDPLKRCSRDKIEDCIVNVKATKITTTKEAEEHLMQGYVLLENVSSHDWFAVELKTPLGRDIQPSMTETVIFGPKDSFTEKIEDNISLIRKRLPITALKAEKFTIGNLSKTTVVLMYIEGLTNPRWVNEARKKIEMIDYDQFLDASQVAFFMEDHRTTPFPQYLETDRPDACAYSLGEGKIVVLVDNTPFGFFAPITLFHLFQSPEDYFMRWTTASFFRALRVFSFFLSITLIPIYVALTSHDYEMIPMQIMFVLLESRSKLPFTPFWEAFLMLLVLEIIKEASLRMPTKTGQTLGVIGGIVVGEAAVQAGFASQVLIVLVGISAIASFLVPNYSLTKSHTLIQFFLLVFSNFLGIFGVILGLVVILAHLNGLASLTQPYLAPVAPFHWKDWKDLFIRAPLPSIKTRPEYLEPLIKWKYKQRR